MKKILTLFAMLLVTASTLLAQTPKLSYQMVVRNNEAQKVGKFNQKDLVYSTQLTGNINILVATNGNYAPAASGNFTATTNMNGMLSLTIVGSDDQTQGNGIVKLDKKLRDINWNQAKIVVGISTYGIKDTMPVYPVPYALSALNHDSTLSTKAIYYYISESTVNDVDTIYKTIMANNELHEAIDSAIVFYIKNNRTAVKNLIFHFLGQLNTDDLNEAYAEYKKNKQLDSALVDTVTKYIINHYDLAKEIALSYARTADVNDAKTFLNAIDGMDQNNVYQIADTLVGAACKYVKDHPEKLKKAFTKILTTDGLVTETRLQYALDYLQGQIDGKTTNTRLYDTMLTFLNDSIIQKYLDENHYLKNCTTNENEVNICDLLTRVQSLENNPTFVKCPDLSKPVATPNADQNPTSYTLKSTITNIPDNLTLGDQDNVNDSIFFVLNFLYSNKQPDSMHIAANIQDIDDVKTMVAEFNVETVKQRGQIIEVIAVLFSHCTPLSAQYSAPDTITLEPIECPQVIALSNTSPDHALTLKSKKGVIVSATLNKNYAEKIQKVGFKVDYADYDGTMKSDTIEAMDTIVNGNTVKIDGENKFYARLDMSFCSKDVKVSGLVFCETDTTESAADKALNFHIRGPKFEIISSAAPENKYFAFGDSITLTAKDSFLVGDNGKEYCANLVAGYYSINEILSYCSSFASQIGVSAPTYHWKLENKAPEVYNGQVYKVAPDSTVTYVAWMDMVYSGASCKVYDTLQITYKPYECKDTLVASEDTLIGPKVKISSDHENNLCHGSHDVITLASTSFLLADTTTPKDNKLDTIYLKDVKKNVSFYDGIIDSVAYDWFDTLGHAITATGTNKDTLKMTVDRDSVIVCRLTVKFSNDTICEKNDTITVNYKFVCEDDMRDIQGNKYGTIDVNGYCWTKTNMRSTRKADNSGNITLGAQTPTETITNGSAKYYTVSTDLVSTYNEDNLGYLYNHAAADSLCPEGWHLPTDEEWQKLEQYVDTLGTGSHTTITFSDSAMTTYAKYIVVPGDFSWFNSTSADDKIHFNAYPAGARQLSTLVPQGQGMYGYRLAGFWTATAQPNTTNKYYARVMDPTTVGEKILRDGVNHAIGFSVRCVNDIVPVTCPSLGATTITWDVQKVTINTNVENYDGTSTGKYACEFWKTTTTGEQLIDSFVENANIDNGKMTNYIGRAALHNLIGTAQLSAGDYKLMIKPILLNTNDCENDTAAVVTTSFILETVGGIQTYPIIMLGTQTWMGENLNRALEANTQDPCANTDGCSNKGLLYNVNALTGTQSICPSGWSLPTAAQIQVLDQYLNDNNVSFDLFDYQNAGYYLTPNGHVATPNHYMLSSDFSQSFNWWYRNSETGHLVTSGIEANQQYFTNYYSTVRCIKANN